AARRSSRSRSRAPATRAASAAGPIARTWRGTAPTRACASAASGRSRPRGEPPAESLRRWQVELGLPRVAPLEVVDHGVEGLGLTLEGHSVGVDLQHLQLAPDARHPVVVGTAQG